MHLSWQRNLGTVDRVLRIIVGLALLYLAVFQPIAISSTVSILLWIGAAFMLAEGILAY